MVSLHRDQIKQEVFAGHDCVIEKYGNNQQ